MESSSTPRSSTLLSLDEYLDSAVPFVEPYAFSDTIPDMTAIFPPEPAVYEENRKVFEKLFERGELARYGNAYVAVHGDRVLHVSESAHDCQEHSPRSSFIGLASDGSEFVDEPPKLLALIPYNASGEPLVSVSSVSVVHIMKEKRKLGEKHRRRVPGTESTELNMAKFPEWTLDTGADTYLAVSLASFDADEQEKVKEQWALSKEVKESPKSKVWNLMADVTFGTTTEAGTRVRVPMRVVDRWKKPGVAVVGLPYLADKVATLVGKRVADRNIPRDVPRGHMRVDN